MVISDQLSVVRAVVRGMLERHRSSMSSAPVTGEEPVADPATRFAAELRDSGMFESSAIDYSRGSLKHVDDFLNVYAEEGVDVPSDVAQGVAAYVVRCLRHAGTSMDDQQAQDVTDRVVEAVHDWVSLVHEFDSIAAQPTR